MGGESGGSAVGCGVGVAAPARSMFSKSRGRSSILMYVLSNSTLHIQSMLPLYLVSQGPKPDQGADRQGQGLLRCVAFTR